MIIEAIKALGVTEFACDSEPTKEAFENTYRSDSVDNPSITWEQVSAKIVELEAEYDSQEYARNRKDEYDALNQLELMSDDSINGTTTHKDAIVAIKAKWPKDNSGPV